MNTGDELFSDEQRWRIAIHEASHAVVATLASLECLNTTNAVELLQVARTKGGIPTEYNGSKGSCNGLCRVVSPALQANYNFSETPGHQLRARRLQARWMVRYLLAGPYGELRSLALPSAFAWEHEQALGGESNTDFACARHVFGQLSRSGGRRVAWETVHKEAKQLVAEHWGTINQLALALAAAGRMNNSEMMDVIGPLTPSQRFALAA